MLQWVADIVIDEQRSNIDAVKRLPKSKSLTHFS
jgi:hypothetical protein